MVTGWRITLAKALCGTQRSFLKVWVGQLIIFAYASRICLSVAITVMVNKTVSNDSISEPEGVCPIEKTSLAMSHNGPERGKFNWSEDLQGLILSAFYFGYALTEFYGEGLARKFGAKSTLGSATLLTGFFTAITPVFLDHGGPYALIALRVLMGLGQGPMFPAISVLLEAWFPLNERNLTIGVLEITALFGVFLSTMFSGFYVHLSERWGGIFYFIGGLTMGYSILFGLLCYDEPLSHPFISDEEKDYLQSELGNLQRNKNLPPVPWKHILSSSRVMALMVAQTGFDCGFYMMVTNLPKYMADVMQLSITEIAVLASTPFFAMMVFSISSLFLAKWLINSDRLGATAVRKLFTVIGAVGSAGFFLGASFAGCQRGLALALFFIGIAFMGFFHGGIRPNPFDLSPNYGGTIMALANGFGAIIGIGLPITIAFVTPNTTVQEWRIPFYVVFGMLIGTSVLYLLGGSGKVQPWNDPTTMVD